jgi:hypothetical protein
MSRHLVVAGLACALIVVAAVPALAASRVVRTTDRSGHAVFSVRQQRDPDSRRVRKTVTVKACDDRKDGAGIVAFFSNLGKVQARGGAGTCGKARTFSYLDNGIDRIVTVCRQDASKHGPRKKCRDRTV